MITNRIGYAPAVRQSAPQRQNFRGNVSPRNLLVAEYRMERGFSRLDKVVIGVFGTMAAGLMAAGGVLINETHRSHVRLPKACSEIKTAVKDTAAARRIVGNSEALTSFNNTKSLTELMVQFRSPAEKYLQLTQDSLAGKPVSPAATYFAEIAKGKVVKKLEEPGIVLRAQADSLKAQSDSLRAKADSISRHAHGR